MERCHPEIPQHGDERPRLADAARLRRTLEASPRGGASLLAYCPVSFLAKASAVLTREVLLSFIRQRSEDARPVGTSVDLTTALS
jgi:hypothetical protein